MRRHRAPDDGDPKELGDRTRLSFPVTSLVSSATGVVVSGPGGAVRCDRVVVTVPPALTGRLHCEPRRAQPGPPHPVDTNPA
ncbi:FAD-dependent oxidoreductase [Micromonospora sp. KC723]|uniref:FAD-dependent oxidoreductase n=1 Tax=Micromonospora sp. KC723 TaxID=2530381 RepID=UPI00352F2B8E